MDIILNSLQCWRCSHRWVPRKVQVRVCPRCHSPYWDKEKGGPQSEAQIPDSAIKPVLDKMVRRIVERCNPEKIILFGSHATGHARPGSDVDLLVITRHGESKRRLAGELYCALWDAGVAKDILVVRPEEFERYREVVGTVIYPAAHEGKVIYDRAA